MSDQLRRFLDNPAVRRREPDPEYLGDDSFRGPCGMRNTEAFAPSHVRHRGLIPGSPAAKARGCLCSLVQHDDDGWTAIETIRCPGVARAPDPLGDAFRELDPVDGATFAWYLVYRSAAGVPFPNDALRMWLADAEHAAVTARAAGEPVPEADRETLAADAARLIALALRAAAR